MPGLTWPDVSQTSPTTNQIILPCSVVARLATRPVQASRHYSFYRSAVIVLDSDGRSPLPARDEPKATFKQAFPACHLDLWSISTSRISHTASHTTNHTAFSEVLGDDDGLLYDFSSSKSDLYHICTCTDDACTCTDDTC